MLTQLRILVDDFPASYRFYRDVLGLTPQERGQEPERAEAGPYGAFKDEKGGTDLALLDRALMAGALEGAQHGERASGVHVGQRGEADHVVVVFRVADVDAAYAEAVGRGAQAAGTPNDQPEWGMRVAHVRAPEGTLIEFCSWDG